MFRVSQEWNKNAQRILEEYAERNAEERKFLPKAFAWDRFYEFVRDNCTAPMVLKEMDKILVDIVEQVGLIESRKESHKLSLSAIDVDLRRGRGNVLAVCECLKYSAVCEASEVDGLKCAHVQ